MSSLRTIPKTMLTRDGSVKAVKYRKLDGSNWTPRNYCVDATKVAWTPIEITSPGPISTVEAQNDRVDSIHAKRRFLIRSIAMGLPMSKIALTDLSIRILYETQFDVYLNRTFKRGLEIPLKWVNRPPPRYIRGQIRPGRDTRPPLDSRVDISTLEKLFAVYIWLEENGYPEVLSKIEKRTLIPFKTYTTPPGGFPKIFAINGDDNVMVAPAIATQRSIINTEKRGQGVQGSKLASSNSYLSYCQQPGRSPITQLVNIILDNYVRLSSEGEMKWKYEVKPGKPLYITYDHTRHKLLSQPAKGGDREITTGDTVVTGRSNLLIRESSFLSTEDRIKLSFLHQVAFPQWYLNTSITESLPSSLGGIGQPNACNPQDIWDALPKEHKQLIEAARGDDALLAHRAIKTLNRSKVSKYETPEGDLHDRSALGREAVRIWNAECEADPLKKDFQIRLRSYSEALIDTINSLSHKTQKDLGDLSSLISSMSAVTSDTSVSVVSARTPKVGKSIIAALHADYTTLDLFDRQHSSRSHLVDVYKGKAPAIKPVVPHRDAERARKRIKSSSIAKHAPEPSATAPPGKTPFEWLYGVDGPRAAKIYIRREDLKHLCPPRSLSMLIYPGLMHGITEEVPVNAFKNEKRSQRFFQLNHTVERMVTMPPPVPLRKSYIETLSDRISELSVSRLQSMARKAQQDDRSAEEDLEELKYSYSVPREPPPTLPQDVE